MDGRTDGRRLEIEFHWETSDHLARAGARKNVRLRMDFNRFSVKTNKKNEHSLFGGFELVRLHPDPAS